MLCLLYGIIGQCNQLHCPASIALNKGLKTADPDRVAIVTDLKRSVRASESELGSKEKCQLKEMLKISGSSIIYHEKHEIKSI